MIINELDGDDGDNVGDNVLVMTIMCTLSHRLSIYALYAVIVIIPARVCLPVPRQEYVCQGTVYGAPSRGDEREHQRATPFLNLTIQLKDPKEIVGMLGLQG